jgi:glycerate kinase
VDVRNPLCGPAGARVFAAQKGATREAEERLHRGLERLADVTEPAGPRLRDSAGAGAAGGLGFGLLYFAGATLTSGAEWFIRRRGLAARVPRARLVIVTEGAFDATSAQGKLTGEVLRLAREAGVPGGVVAPRAALVPAGVAVESGGGQWSAGDLAERTRLLVERSLRARRGE